MYLWRTKPWPSRSGPSGTIWPCCRKGGAGILRSQPGCPAAGTTATVSGTGRPDLQAAPREMCCWGFMTSCAPLALCSSTPARAAPTCRIFASLRTWKRRRRRLPPAMPTGASALKERIAWRKLCILSIGCRKTDSTPSFCSSKSRIFSLSAGICTPTIPACRRKR